MLIMQINIKSILFYFKNKLISNFKNFNLILSYVNKLKKNFSTL